MCGINGFISLDDSFNSIAPEKLKLKIQVMNDTLIHRGPDSEGIYLKEPVAFGFRRLSIIDLDDSANQPMLNIDKNIVIVFNGEIYNYVEIKNDLLKKGYKFRTKSDTEVILNSYIEYGEQCVQRFNGMWAFAIYDFRKKRLVCSRDRMGVKPFYYTIIGNQMFFSSELKAIQKVTNQTSANHQKIYQYLAYGYRINDGETFFENVYELLPGTNLIFDNGHVTFDKYWTLKENLFHHKSNPPDYFEEFVELFKSAVKLRYRSDVPVALLLSGGLDSTSIAKVTDELIESGELETNDINAFIASFPNFEDDETAIAREFIQTVKHIKLHEIQIDSQNIVDGFEKLIYDFDHPLFSFNTVVHNNIMRECKKRGIKVVINGQGSDEAFAGYVRYISGVHLIDKLISPKGHFIKEFQALHKKNGYDPKFLLSQMFKALISPSLASYLRARYQEKIIPVMDHDFVHENNEHYDSTYRFSLRGDNVTHYLLDKINHQGLNTILHYEDISSMNQSIEIRSPFMDYRLMEFAFSIPNELKFKNGVTKVIIRETIGKMLPDSITKNRKKIGFNTPFIDYIAEDKNFRKYVNEILVSSSFRNKKIWDSEKLAGVYKDPKKYPNFPFWRIINLEIWSKVYGINNL